MKALQPNFFIASLIDILHEDPSAPGGGHQHSSSFGGGSYYSSHYQLDNSVASYDADASYSSNYNPGGNSCGNGGGAFNDASVSSSGFESLAEGHPSAAASSSPPSPSSSIVCSSHSGQSLKFFCCDCDTGICPSCADIEHREHKVIGMSEAADRDREELRSLVDCAQRQVPILNESIDRVNQLSLALQEKQEDLSAEINRVFDDLIRIVDARRNELLEELRNREQQKQATLGKTNQPLRRSGDK